MLATVIRLFPLCAFALIEASLTMPLTQASQTSPAMAPKSEEAIGV